MENNKYLLRDIAESYNKLLILEEQYKNVSFNRLQVRESILKALRELGIQLNEFNEIYKDKSDYWLYHAIGDRKCIIIHDNESFLKMVLALANKTKDRYQIREIDVLEKIEDSYKNRKVKILSDKDSLGIFMKGNQLYVNDLVRKLNHLAEKRRPFIMLSGLINEYPDKYLREKIATVSDKDIILCVNKNDALDNAINLLVDYMTINGSDFSDINIDVFASEIVKGKYYVKRRKVNEQKYIKYNEK